MSKAGAALEILVWKEPQVRSMDLESGYHLPADHSPRTLKVEP